MTRKDKGISRPHLRKRFCPRGHDKIVVGVYTDGQCILCARAHANTKKAKAQVIKWFQDHPEKIKEYNAKKYSYKSSYGITFDDVKKMMKLQDYKCAICKKKKKLCVDHVHKLNKVVRGLLCLKCNLGLGHFEDNTQLLQSAITYLKRFA